MKCLEHDERCVQHPVLRALGNTIAGNDEQTQVVINMGVCDKLLTLLDLRKCNLFSNPCDLQLQQNSEKTQKNDINIKLAMKLNSDGVLLREVCWIISNITAGTEEQIDCIIRSDKFAGLINVLKTESLEIRKEAAWAIANAADGGNNIQIEYLVQKGVIPAFISILLHKKNKNYFC